jgi:hypothetical protein
MVVGRVCRKHVLWKDAVERSVSHHEIPDERLFVDCLARTVKVPHPFFPRPSSIFPPDGPHLRHEIETTPPHGLLSASTTIFETTTESA